MNPYEVLGVDKKATQEQIKEAHRARAMENHPDSGGDVEKFKQIQAAYELLSDESKRARYDSTGMHWDAPLIDDIWKMIGEQVVAECQSLESDPNKIIANSLYGRSTANLKTDVFRIVFEKIRSANQNHKSEVIKLEKKAKRWRNFLGRFKRLNNAIEKTEKYAYMVKILESQERDCLNFIGVLKRKIEFGDLALAEIKDMRLDQNFDSEESESGAGSQEKLSETGMRFLYGTT